MAASEMTLFSIITNLLHFGMVVRGLLLAAIKRQMNVEYTPSLGGGAGAARDDDRRRRRIAPA